MRGRIVRGISNRPTGVRRLILKLGVLLYFTPMTRDKAGWTVLWKLHNEDVCESEILDTIEDYFGETTRFQIMHYMEGCAHR